jgi:RHS repeat-associated protein
MLQKDYRTLANSPSGPIADSDVFTFDKAGRMLTAVSGRYTNTVTNVFDPMGRHQQEKLTVAGQTYTITHDFDSLGRPFKMTYPDGTITEKSFTDRGQLYQTKYAGSVIDTRTYDDGGRLSTSTYSNGAVTTHNYRVSGSNKDNLLASIVTTNPGSNKVGTYSYTWDANKNKTAETITNSPLSGYGFSTGATGYDDENRVTAWSRSDNNQNQTWNLSLVGDWNSVNQTGTSPLSQSRTHGPTHEFTSFIGTNSGTITYDVKGNMNSRPASLAAPALNLVWDFDNKLKGADNDNTPATLEVMFTYDALGRRVSSSESGSTVIYLQSGQQTIADYASGAAPSSPTYRYVYGSYIDELLLRETITGSAKHFYHRNQQYSVTALTNNTGDTIELYCYTAHGAVTFLDNSGLEIPNSGFAIRHTYTGREWDSALAMHYFRSRWFDTNAGRFLSRDSIGLVDGTNLYSDYFGLANLDPTGRSCMQIGDFCGPDSTIAFTSFLARISPVLRSLPTDELGPIDGFWWLWDYGGSIDFYLGKGTYIPTTFPGCATGKCSNSVDFCGKCVRQTVLNNILYGVVAAAHDVPPGTAEDGANIHNWWRGKGWEGWEQKCAYAIGNEFWLQIMRTKGKRHSKDQFCRIFNKFDKNCGNKVSSAFDHCSSCGLEATEDQFGRVVLGDTRIPKFAH